MSAAPVNGAMHTAIMRFRGAPADLLPRYDALCAEVPAESFLFHACLVGDDGIILVDTCPTREAYEAFHAGEWFRDAIDRHGLPQPTIEGHPVHTARAAGATVTP